MKLVLMQNVDKLGAKGELIEVKDGFGRNYLIPNGLAVMQSDARAKNLLNQIESHKGEKEIEDKKKREEAEKINGKVITIKGKASKSTLFASISKNEIAKELGIPAEHIKLDEPIKELGDHKVSIDFGGNISAQITVKVEKA